METYVVMFKPEYRDQIREYLENNEIKIRAESHKRHFISFSSTAEQFEKMKNLEGIISIYEDYQYAPD